MNLPLLIFTFIDMVLFLIYAVFVSEHTMHMFQLNYYRLSEQMRWFKVHRSSYIGHLTLAVLMLISSLIPWPPLVKAILLFPLLAIGCVSARPKKAKKPLVHTNRVKRMDITISVLLLAVCLVPFVLFKDAHQTFIFVILSVVFLVSPLIVLLANFINVPIERSINRYYINDAKRIIDSTPNLKVIGITGSYGKTSVKYFLTSLLRSSFNVLMTPASYNTTMGVVKTIRNDLKATDEIFVCEMGAKWVGDIKEICDIVKPQFGIITSIGPQHLESMGSLENIKKTKFELADSLPLNGALFLNGDDENIAEHNSKRQFNAITYSISGNGDYNAEILSINSRGTSFVVTAPDGTQQEFSTKLIGRHNVLNITGAIAVCHALGIQLEALKGSVRKLVGVPHRLEMKKANNLTIIDDAYNANPEGTKLALEALSFFDGYKILVTPGMVELGQKQYELNKLFGIQAAKVADFVVLVGQKQAVPIKDGLLESGYDESNIFVANDIHEALNKVYSLQTQQEKVVLLENDLPDNY